MFVYLFASFWFNYCIHTYTHCLELIKSVGSHGSSSLLSLAEGDGLTLVSDSHKLLSVLCHLKCCHGDFLAISYIYFT
jgi:hypothetical protein